MRTKILSLFIILNLFIFDGVQAFTFSDTTNTASLKDGKKEKTKDEGPKKGKLYAAPLPVVASNPTFGVLYGFA